MSKEQIEEMAKDLCQLNRDCAECSHSGMCQATKYANRAYSAGYRKQSEGEWKVNGVYFKTLNCSVCDYTANSIYEKTNYCPNCGAKMKGGAK